MSTYEIEQEGRQTIVGKFRAVGGATGDVPTQQADGTLAQQSGGGSLEVTDGTTTVTPVTEIDFTSGAVVTDGGDGVAQVAVGFAPVQGVYLGNSVAVANGGAGNLTFDTKASGTELLDRSDPANPAFLAAGTYAISLQCNSGAGLTAGGSVTVGLTVAGETLPEGYTQKPQIGWGVSGVVVAGVGNVITATVQNFDGALSRNFSIASAVIVKLA